MSRNRYLILPPGRVDPALAMMVALKYGAAVKTRDGKLALASNAPGVLEGVRQELGLACRIVTSRRWDRAPLAVVPEDAGEF